MISRLKGEFEAVLGGEPVRFDTRLGTIASIEELCGDLGIVEIVNKAVFSGRTRDRIGLLSASLRAKGCPADEADRRAGDATLDEAEAFILALMGALGFEVAPRRAGEARPLDGASAGGSGASSPSAA